MNFNDFKAPIARHFAELATYPLFVTDVPQDDLWLCYLASFPEGTNPIFRERTEHDCSCCRHFVKIMGAVVGVVDGELKSIWDTTFSDPAYQAVADTMSELVKGRAIAHPFLHYEKHVGVDKNFERKKGSKEVVATWGHFHVDLPHRSNTGRNFVCDGAEIATVLGKAKTTHDVLLRALQEIKPEAVETVLDLINRGALYRGDQYKNNVLAFSALRSEFLAGGERDAFVWLTAGKVHESISGIRNSAIGTLLIDLSKGKDLEQAVRSYEKITAPESYKRPTALVTQAMIDKAQEEIVALGLESALERRYARLTDVSVRDILFADRAARKLMRGGLFDDLPTKASKPKASASTKQIHIESFLGDVLPGAETIEVFFENRHAPNLVSLIAPQHADVKPLFKWDNGFSWTYNGGFTDRIKERVKAAGGNVTGDLCCRLAWHNLDDLDLHMVEPGGNIRTHTGHVFFGEKGPSRNGGKLDVDMNAFGPKSREPVENIFYGKRSSMRDGVYELYVDQYQRRESTDVGFEVEIDLMGDVTRFVYDKAVDGTIPVARITVQNGNIAIVGMLTNTQPLKSIIWRLKTGDWHRVSAMMLSPNYWHVGGGTGNKHYLFMLDNCANDAPARGFFNEYLHSDLDKHRKVLEMVGAKAMVAPEPNQLSGLGFSSTLRNDLLVKVKSTKLSTNRTYMVIF